MRTLSIYQTTSKITAIVAVIRLFGQHLKKMSTEKNQDSFKRRGTNIYYWLERSKELKASAKLIWEHSKVHYVKNEKVIDSLAQFYRVSMLLMGLSLETLLKALIIARDDNQISNGKIHKTLKTHDLIKLIERVDFDVNDKEEHFLFRASENVVWLSRYPVPTRIPDNVDDPVKAFVRRDDDYETFEIVYERIENEIKNVSQQGV